jgi:hypothetical protein
MKWHRRLVLFMGANTCFACLTAAVVAADIRIPAFTAYLDPDVRGARVSQRSGITGWNDPTLKVLWFGDIRTAGKLDCSVTLRLPAEATSQLRLTVSGQTHQASVKGSGADLVTADFGSFDLPATGYQRFTLESLNPQGQPVGDVNSLTLSGPAAQDAHFNLLSRRNAASVHLVYPVDKGVKVEAFYCEVTALEDPLWTYYMACGWHRGYFGMQVNSPTERRIIFSVWDSGGEGADRAKVADADRVKLIAKGPDVYTGDFGNEGTGGHSHLKYIWKTGQKQRFIVTARPTDATHTIYSGYYFHPDKQQWVLISSWQAPKEGGYLRGLYSFSENFDGSNGHMLRKALYGNQWIRTADNPWIELTTATFSHDATGKSDRLDRFMGVENGQFFLSHGGFVAGYTQYGEKFTRPATAQAPSDLVLPDVVTYPTAAEETLSNEYEVLAAGLKVDVYAARVLDPPFAGKEYDYGGPYSFANFDMSGPVTVRITSKRPLRSTVIRPQSSGVQPAFEDDHTLTLTLDRPRKLSIEPDGKKGPLLLFANPLQTDVPKPGDPNVVAFAPGVHKPERIVLRSNQTLYLAGGAVVKAEVLVEGSNIRICGRGILDGSDWPWRTGPIGNLIAIRNSSDVEVSGITLRGSAHWTIVPKNSRRVTIRNVKLCNSRVQNDDGINPCNSQDMRITDCFIRTDDDCVALKGLDFTAADSNVERIVVEDSVLWCDRARIFLLGHESRAAFMRGVTLRNLDIIHFAMTPFLLEPGEDMRLEDVTMEDIRIHGEGQRELIRLRPTVNQYMQKQTPGSIRDVHFKNVTVEGQPGEYLVQIEGADPNHGVADVVFENVSITGEKLTTESKRLRVGKNVRNVLPGN